MWQEAYLSACVRAILFADDGNYRIAGYRKLDPIPNVASEARFLEAAHNLFEKGRVIDSQSKWLTLVSKLAHLPFTLIRLATGQ